MTKEERVEKLKIEYQLYECKEVYSLKDALFFIEDSQDFFDDVLFAAGKEKNVNKLRKVASIALGKRRKEFGYMPPVDYDIDNGLLQLEETICMGSTCLLQRLADRVNDDNVEVVSQLMHFTQDKCEEDVARIENYRKIARDDSIGYVAVSWFEKSLNFDAFSEFFNEAIVDATYVANPKYTKKSSDK